MIQMIEISKMISILLLVLDLLLTVRSARMLDPVMLEDVGAKSWPRLNRT